MKKVTKQGTKLLAALLIAAMLVSSLFACAPTTEQNDNPMEEEATRLSAPLAISNGGIVSWNAIADATGYQVYVDGQPRETVGVTYFTLPDDGVHEVYIIALGDGTHTISSARSNKVTVTGGETSETDVVFMNMILQDGAWDYSGNLDEAIRYVENKQSKDADLFKLFEDVFIEHLDNDGGYRGEFWGKTMRGAVLAYRYTLDDDLYTIMENSTKRILTAQEPSGRLASLDADNEFRGWELWGRTYVVLGMLHFYSVCRDENLKADIIESCRRQLDYVMERVGDGKIDILSTSPDWGGLPSSRILQAYLSVYCLTEEQKYLDYASYLIGTGGCSMKSSEGRTILEDCMLKTPFYKWGCRKVYEVTNFFDGILMYYILTGDQNAKQLSLNYFEVVSATEITETGGVATDVEEANNAVVEQCDPSNLGRMQENCALVAWLRFCFKIYRVFDLFDAVEVFEKAYYNIIMATVDHDYHFELPFFSYNPLATMAKTTTYSGGAHVKDRFYSCCVAMGNGALGLAPQVSLMSNQQGLTMNLYFSGTVQAKTPSGSDVTIINETELPSGGKTTVRISVADKETFSIRFRIPAWSRTSSVKVNGIAMKNVNSGSYFTVTRQWSNGDTVELEFDMAAYLIHGSEQCSNPNGKYNVVVKRGPVVYARDRRIEGDNIFQPVTFEEIDGKLTAEVVDVNIRHQVGLKVKTADGYITLVDYGSAGTTQDDESIMCLWIPTRDYWSVDLTKDIVVRCFEDGSPNTWDGDVLKTAQAYKDTSNQTILQHFAWRLIPAEEKEGWYRILDVNSNQYLTVHDNGYTLTRTSEVLSGDSQLFQIKTVGLNRYKIEGMYGKLITVHDQTLETYMFEDISHVLQYWYFENLE